MIDIKKYKKTLQIYKLYELPRNSLVSFVDENQSHIPWILHHIDGMYSYCSSIEEVPEIFHVKAWTEVYLWQKVNGENQ